MQIKLLLAALALAYNVANVAADCDECIATAASDCELLAACTAQYPDCTNAVDEWEANCNELDESYSYSHSYSHSISGDSSYSHSYSDSISGDSSYAYSSYENSNEDSSSSYGSDEDHEDDSSEDHSSHEDSSYGSSYGDDDAISAASAVGVAILALAGAVAAL